MSRINPNPPRLNSRRNNVTRPPQLELGSLNAPGEVASPPDFSRANAAARFGQLFGQAGGLIEQLGRRNRISDEREAAAARGEASRQALEQIPGVLEQLGNGDIEVPGNIDPGEFAQELARVRLPAGASQEYADAYTEQFLRRVAPSVVQARTAARNAARNELAIGFKASITSTDLGNLDARIGEAALALDLDPQSAEFADALIKPGLDAALDTLDRERFEAFASRLEGTFPELVADRRRRLDAGEKGQENLRAAQRAEAAENAVAEALNHNNPEMAARRLESARDITPRTRGVLADRIRSHREDAAKKTREQTAGVLLEIDDPDEFTTELGSAIEGGVLSPDDGRALSGVFQRQHATRLQARALSDPSARDTVLDEANRGLAIAADDPTDPRALTAEQYGSIVRAAAGTAARATKRDLELRAIGSQLQRALAGESPGAVDASDDAILTSWVGTGIAEGEVSGDSVVLGRVTNPVAAAFQAGALGKVPKPWSTKIISGFDRNVNLDESGRSLLALHRADPLLAREVIASAGSPEGRARAEAFLHRASEEIGESASTADASVSRLATETAELAPVSLSREQVGSILREESSLSKNGSLDTVAVETLKGNLPEEFRGTTGFWFGKATFLFDRDIDVSKPESEVRDYFVDQLHEAFQARKMLGESDSTAVNNAKMSALAGTYRRFPPIQWHDKVLFLRGSDAIPDFGSNARTKIQRDIEAGVLDGITAGQVMRKYQPRWSEAERGWNLAAVGNRTDLLRDADGDPYLLVRREFGEDVLQEMVDDIMSKVNTDTLQQTRYKNIVPERVRRLDETIESNRQRQERDGTRVERGDRAVWRLLLSFGGDGP